MSRKLGSIEFLVTLVVIAFGAIFFWFWWYMPAQNKITVRIYKTAMEMTRAGVAACRVSDGKIKSGFSGEKICGENSISAWPEIPLQCGGKPYFSVSQKKDKWSVTTLFAQDGAVWDCLGCRLECGEDKCEPIGDCKN